MAWLQLPGPWAGQGRGDVAVALEGRGTVAMGSGGLRHQGHEQQQDPSGTLCPQVCHEVFGQETHQDEAGRDSGPQRAHHAVPRQHRGEGRQAPGRAGTLVTGCGTGKGRGTMKEGVHGTPLALCDPVSPARTARSSCACRTPSTHPTSSASSSTS